MSQPSPTLKLAVPRHLQDYNGYCGPACAMMVFSSEAPASLPEQQALFREIRQHAKQANDRRPIKSPAESLLALLSKNSRARWRKVFDPVPDKVAALLVDAVVNIGQPCLLLVSKGMHWVVAFGITRHDDGSVAGVLMRDPAWAGMPAFYGLSVFPEKSTFTHSAEPCTCLQSDNRPGSVHERYMAMGELLSPRGLQGTPDWEGKGAIAIVPDEVRAAAALPPPAATPPAAPGLTPQAAAMIAVREHGLVGRPDSPPDWQQTLEGGQPGTPILVKDPDDPRDDFYLVPVHAPGASLRAAWIMLDPVTLQLREASLLDHWMAPAFPTDQDAKNIASEDVTLPDGTRHRFKISDLRPNQRNLVWQASAASILPYWPVREFVAPHPITGEPVSIYATQHGKIYAALLPEEVPEAPGTASSQPPDPTPAQPGVRPWPKILSAIVGGVAIVAGIAIMVLNKPSPAATPQAQLPPLHTEASGLSADIARTETILATDLSATLAALETESKPPLTDATEMVDVSLWLVEGFKPDGVRFDGITTDPVRNLEHVVDILEKSRSLDTRQANSEAADSALAIQKEMKVVREKWHGLDREIKLTRRAPRAFLEAMLQGYQKMVALEEGQGLDQEALNECKRFAAAYAVVFSKMLTAEDAERIRQLIAKVTALESTVEKRKLALDGAQPNLNVLLKRQESLQSRYTLTLAAIDGNLPANDQDVAIRKELDLLLPALTAQLRQRQELLSEASALLPPLLISVRSLKTRLEERLKATTAAISVKRAPEIHPENPTPLDR